MFDQDGEESDLGSDYVFDRTSFPATKPMGKKDKAVEDKF